MEEGVGFCSNSFFVRCKTETDRERQGEAERGSNRDRERQRDGEKRTEKMTRASMQVVCS